MAIALVMSVFHIPAHATETENTTGDATLTEMPLVEEPAVSPAQVESDQATLTEEPGVLAEQLPAAPADDTHAHPTERFATVEQHNAAKPSTCQSDGKIRPEEIKNLYLRTKDDGAKVKPWVTMQFGFDLALDGTHCAGDSIIIDAPKQLGSDGLDVAMQANDGTVIANATYKKHKVTVTLTEAVENPNNFGFVGDAWWRVSLQSNVEVGVNDLEWSVDGKVIRTPITVPECPTCSNISKPAAKWGHAEGDKAFTTLSFPIGEHDGQVIHWKEELTSSNQRLACDQLPAHADVYSKTNYWGSGTNYKRIPLNVESCTATEARGTLTVDKGWKASFRVTATIDPNDPGPWTDKATFIVNGQPVERIAIAKRSEAGGSGSYKNREVVTPGKPTVKGEATCVNGVSGAKIVIPATANVKYSINDKPASAGEHPMPTGNVTVTAVATDPSKYVLEGETIWRFTNKDCPKPIKPEKPTIIGGAACEGIVSDAKIIIPASDHLRYKIDGKPARVGENPVGNRTSVTVTAELIDPTKHTLEGESSWTFTVKDCPKPITPEKPVQKGSVNCIDCATAPRQQAMIVIPNTPGVEYRVNDKVLTPGEHELASGESVVTVDAIDPSKTVLEGTTQWIFTVEDCNCPKPPSTPKPEPKPNGSSEAGIGILVFLAVAVPLVALLLHHIPMIKQWLPQPPAQKPANPEQKPSAPAKGMPKKGVEKKGIAK